MCGIAGIIAAPGTEVNLDAVYAMRKALKHRGPDGDGLYVNGSIALAQTRLAIIDLATGDQPLYAPGGIALVANGEIYNYLELKQEMAEAHFATASDCEVPLHLYRREGPDFAEHLRGMYAIALHDAAEDRLLLSRDPFGIKPLYYVAGPAGLAFASEPGALLDAGLAPRRIVPRSRDELLQLQFTTGRDTIFEGIQRLLPGETLVVSRARIVERRRIDPLPALPPVQIGEAAALAELDKVLLESVTLHQRSDVPYGMFLSGGVDSAALLAAMARVNDRPVLAYTAGFDRGEVNDERAHARAVAGALGAEHVEVEFGEQDFWDLLPRIAAAVDDPAADYAVLPTWKLAERAAQDVKVVLSGEGGDEIFAGYGRYRSAIRPWWRGGRAMRPRGIFDGLGVLRQEPTGWRDGIVAAESLSGGKDRNRLQSVQAVDCADWLPNDLLTKLDRCLMAHGLEGRTPYLDPALAAFAYRLPDGLKIRGRLGKYLLRAWLDKAVPVAGAFTRKRGFTVPVGSWIAARGDRLGPLVAAQPGVAEACHPDAVRRLYGATGKHAAFACWTLLFYALWHQHHVVGRPAEGDVTAMLE
ncbi:asparagine synthase (glutamine-hydrolyzing) [Marinibaculum pumilum]|uniref:asparagine synthase (glutamine-hydrolyzing) n=1 Tax=Marinibaculum pumilum TaxID=1766165 RepID=A0ABV7KZP6_9PROT